MANIFRQNPSGKISADNFIGKSFASVSDEIINEFFENPPGPTIYYVDATLGNDGNDGKSEAKAWKTINKINISSFNAGDSILFKRGEIWREKLTVPSSGLLDNPITFGTYGSGNKPIIKGSDILTGFDPVNGGIANLSDENFEGSGYEESWSETVGSGSVVDEDNSEVSRPPGGGAQILKIQKISPNFNAGTQRDLGSEQSITYTRAYVRIAAEGLSNGNELRIITAVNASYVVPYAVCLAQVSDNLKFKLEIYYNGTWNEFYYPASGGINLNQWYRVDIKYDYTAKTWAWRIDTTVINNGDLSGTIRNPPEYWNLGNTTDSYTLTAYFDLFAIDSTGYINPGSPNTYSKSGVTTEPKCVFYDAVELDYNQGATVGVGTNEWDWAANVLYVNIGEDPDNGTLEAGQRDHCVYTEKAYIIIDNFHLSHSNSNSVYVWTSANNFIIQNSEISQAPGIVLWGGYGKVAYCYVHDLTMIINDLSPDNDHGAIGVVLLSSNNEVCYNQFINCRHDSYDYEEDGGAIEIYNALADVDNNIIHHNWAENCVGFLEVDGSVSYSIDNNSFYYNISVDNTDWFILNNKSNVTHNMSFYNNVIIDRTDYPSPKYNLLRFNVSPTNEVIFKNNIIVIDDWYYVCDSDNQGWAWIHQYNCYYFLSGTPSLGFSLGTGEMQADPKFINLGGNDFHLQSDSPCRDTGINVGLSEDYYGTSVPQGDYPDIGIHELLELLEYIYYGNIPASLFPSYQSLLDMIYGGNIPLAVLPNSPIAPLEKNYLANLLMALLTDIPKAFLEKSYLGGLPISLLPGYSSMLEKFYLGNIPLSMMPSYQSVLDMVYANPNISLSILPDTLKALLEKFYSGDASIIILPETPKAFLEKGYAGEFPISLLPSYSSILDRLYAGDLSISILPSLLDSYLEKIYQGDISLSLLSGYQSTLEKFYLGDMPLIVLPSTIKAPLEKDYNGAIDLIIIPNSIYLLEGYLEFVYSGDIPLSLFPGYSSTLDKFYSGDIPINLMPSYQFILDRIYGGDINLNLMPGSVRILDVLYDGDIDLKLMPKTIYILIGFFAYGGKLEFGLIPFSKRKFEKISVAPEFWASKKKKPIKTASNPMIWPGSKRRYIPIIMEESK